MLTGLWRTLTRGRRQGLIRQAFYQRKPPGLRLRWRTTAPADSFAALKVDIEQWLTQGGILRYRATTYEPERFLFGGPQSMAAVHRYFDVDSTQWLRLYDLMDRDRLGIAPADISLAQLNDLFGAALPNQPEEIWDAWCQLAQFHGVKAVSTPTDAPLKTLYLGQLAATAASPALRSLQALGRANRQLSDRLTTLAEDGRLQQGLRGVLASVALFHWNRIGLDSPRRLQLLNNMMVHFHPYRRAG